MNRLSVCVLGIALILPAAGCVTGTERAQQQAFQACRAYAGSPAFSSCTQEQLADYKASQSDRAAEFAKLQQDCDEKRARAGAYGAAQDKVTCQGDSPLQYVLDGTN